MGQNLRYRSGEAVFEWRVSRTDWETLEAIRALHSGDVETLFHVRELGDEVTLASAEIRAAAERLGKFLAENSRLLPRTYQFKVERPPHPLMTTAFGGGGMSGIRLPGKPGACYTIQTGLGECYLEGIGAGREGRRDLRQVRELQTENLGTITIRSRAAKTEIRQVLAGIRRFAEACADREIVKTVT